MTTRSDAPDTVTAPPAPPPSAAVPMDAADPPPEDGAVAAKTDQYVNSFKALDDNSSGTIYTKDLRNSLKNMGLAPDDPRLKNFFRALDEQDIPDELDFDGFYRLCAENNELIRNAIQGNMIIPDFASFRNGIKGIYEEIRHLDSGKVADYIPQLKRVDREKFGVSICTIDGQRINLGDADHFFSLQSISKPISYCLALEDQGIGKVHEHVGSEPSGHSFNEITLKKGRIPHNPMINAGAIMCCSLVKPTLGPAMRFQHVLDSWQRLAGGYEPRFNNAVYLSEKNHADRNYALGYFMKEHQAFPEGTDLMSTVDFYIQCCSVEMSAAGLSVVASTLANAGICPLTGEQVFTPDTVKHCLSLMHSCGMYDYSGEFSFRVGLPAKSGVGGGLMIVVPNVMGVCIWAPPLDEYGNSVKGVEFCEQLVHRYNFHHYDSLVNCQKNKEDPRLKRNEKRIHGTMMMCWAASQGDLMEIKKLVAAGVDINEADYDGRTPLHLAASEGRGNVVDYFLLSGADVNCKDRWGNTPFMDAELCGFPEVAAKLRRGGPQPEA